MSGAAPKGFFHVFNEAHTIIYELIQAGAPISEKTVVDISIGQHWAKHWKAENLSAKYGECCQYPHNYPDSHPQRRPILMSLGVTRWLLWAHTENGCKTPI